MNREQERYFINENNRKIRVHGYDRVLVEKLMPEVHTFMSYAWGISAPLHSIASHLAELEVVWLSAVYQAKKKHDVILFFDAFRKACKRFFDFKEESIQWKEIEKLWLPIPEILKRQNIPYHEHRS